MNRKILAAILTTAGLLGAFGESRAGSGQGDQAPELEIDTWFNFDKAIGDTLKDLRGSAVFIEYWQTW